MQKSLRLFSPTPAFKSNQKHKLFVPLTSRAYSASLFMCTRASVLILLLISYQQQYFVVWSLVLIACLLILILDIKHFLCAAKVSGLGYDQAFFIVDGQQRLDAYPIAPIFVSHWLVAITLRVEDSRQRHFLVLGRWNLRKADFHSLRLLLNSL